MSVQLDTKGSGLAGGRARFALTLTALVAFAANSILCRLALGGDAIDPYSFTAVRLGSGALVLSVLTYFRRRRPNGSGGSWSGTLFLMAYALPFSLAYVRLDTGTGALLLFGAVQLSMIGHGLWSGDRPDPLEWVGLAGAVTGLVYLVRPGLMAPDPVGAVSMAIAGVGWGGYSVVGRAEGAPAAATTGNFRRAAVLALPATALAWSWLELSPRGLLLAAVSGGLASGLGYTVWYAALKHLSLTRAALVQLSVPVIAASGGIALLGEALSFRMMLAGAVILGSIALGIMGRGRRFGPSP